MGCFLGCFGISSKRKRRKPANRILPGDSRLVSYEPLDSSVSANLDISEDPISSNPQISNKPKEKSSTKVRKKVSFNLNVQTYEPIPDEETTTYQFLQSVEEKESEKNGEGKVVENTSQWKEIKAKAVPLPKLRSKENIEEPFSSKLSSNCSPRYNQSRPLLQDIAVDASLSNWLTSPNIDEAKIKGSTKNGSIAVDTLSSKKNTCDGSFSWRNRDDRVVLDITNFESF
ncbi:hypothetical protein COLO4_15945 [Corchorus olitorius]|uniref:Uncharacterized protein n=1 Tax=Corchorus olitorius TaxID=93759 RepID=A0A1R3JKI0_9ROSI|nr:hypothetical protein COLO4_15945 [Corchorus olitorius]